MRFLERRPGRAAGEERVVIAGPGGDRAAFGLWFSGRESAGVRPWADLVVEDLAVIPEVEDVEVVIRDDELAMLRAGCRWFKDWYYPEGGREGGTKLQATVPLDDRRRQASEQGLAQELGKFLDRSGVPAVDRDRAHEALEELAG